MVSIKCTVLPVLLLFTILLAVAEAFHVSPYGRSITWSAPFGFQQRDKQDTSSESVAVVVSSLKRDNHQENDDKDPLSSLKDKPANLIILPFVFIIGLDLLANILVITKRSIEHMLTGEYSVWHF